MSLTVKETLSDFEPCPEGSHIARCFAIIDMGLQYNEKFQNESEKIYIGWELCEEKMESGKPFIIYNRYTASLGSKSHLRGMLESWRGKAFTKEELAGFDLKNILNQPCYLTIKKMINEKTSKPYSCVAGAAKIPKGYECPSLLNPVICFDLSMYTEEAYMSVPEGIRAKINLGQHDVRNVEQSENFDVDTDVPF